MTKLSTPIFKKKFFKHLKKRINCTYLFTTLFSDVCTSHHDFEEMLDN